MSILVGVFLEEEQRRLTAVKIPNWSRLKLSGGCWRLLHWGGLHWDHYPGIHVLNQRNCVIHNLIPSLFVPGSIPGVLSSLQILVSPQMMHHVQVANLREEASNCLLVVLAISDGSSPVITPLDHGSWS